MKRYILLIALLIPLNALAETKHEFNSPLDLLGVSNLVRGAMAYWQTLDASRELRVGGGIISGTVVSDTASARRFDATEVIHALEGVFGTFSAGVIDATSEIRSPTASFNLVNTAVVSVTEVAQMEIARVTGDINVSRIFVQIIYATDEARIEEGIFDTASARLFDVTDTALIDELIAGLASAARFSATERIVAPLGLIDNATLETVSAENVNASKEIKIAGTGSDHPTLKMYNGSTYVASYLVALGTNAGLTGAVPNDMIIKNISANALRFGTNNLQRVVISSNGNTSFKVASATYDVYVNGEFYADSVSTSSVHSAKENIERASGGMFDNLGSAIADLPIDVFDWKLPPEPSIVDTTAHAEWEKKTQRERYKQRVVGPLAESLIGTPLEYLCSYDQNGDLGGIDHGPALSLAMSLLGEYRRELDTLKARIKALEER